MPEESRSLEGHVALVTGAAKRLGRAIGRMLGEEGVDVVVHYRSSRAEAEEFAGALTERGVAAWTVQADLAEEEGARTLINRAREAAGRDLDILVNSASIFSASKLLSFDAQELAGDIRVNAFAPLVLARAFAAQGSPGQIVNLLDAKIVEYDSEHAAYHLSKRMLFSLTRMLALELAPEIRVNAVAPGLILPPPGKDEGYLESLVHTVPLKRHGGAEDIVRAVSFLLKSHFITGQVIYVDGGRNLKGRMYGG